MSADGDPTRGRRPAVGHGVVSRRASRRSSGSPSRSAEFQRPCPAAKPQYIQSVAEGRRTRVLKLVAAVAVFAAAVLHGVYLATHWNDRLMALLYGLIGAVQAWLAVALSLGRPNAAQIALGVNAGLIALFFAARVAGPPVGIKPEVVGFLTVLRKSLEALSVILLALSLRRPNAS
jgi:hypothetical protein